MAPDFRVEDRGRLCVLHLLTEPAEQWADDNLPPDALTFGGHGIIMEPGEIAGAVDSLAACGLVSA